MECPVIQCMELGINRINNHRFGIRGTSVPAETGGLIDGPACSVHARSTPRGKAHPARVGHAALADAVSAGVAMCTVAPTGTPAGSLYQPGRTVHEVNR